MRRALIVLTIPLILAACGSRSVPTPPHPWRYGGPTYAKLRSDARLSCLANDMLDNAFNPSSEHTHYLSLLYADRVEYIEDQLTLERHGSSTPTLAAMRSHACSS